MNPFLIFTAFCLTVLALAVCNLLGYPKDKKIRIALSVGLAVGFITWKALYATKMFDVVFQLNFFLVFITIPALTYLLQRNKLKKQERFPVMELVFRVFMAIVYTLVIYFTTFLFSMFDEMYSHHGL